MIISSITTGLLNRYSQLVVNKYLISRQLIVDLSEKSQSNNVKFSRLIVWEKLIN